MSATLRNVWIPSSLHRDGNFRTHANSFLLMQLKEIVHFIIPYFRPSSHDGLFIRGGGFEGVGNGECSQCPMSVFAFIFQLKICPLKQAPTAPEDSQKVLHILHKKIWFLPDRTNRSIRVSVLVLQCVCLVSFVFHLLFPDREYCGGHW